jgi:hypothetical protein
MMNRLLVIARASLPQIRIDVPRYLIPEATIGI